MKDYEISREINPVYIPISADGQMNNISAVEKILDGKMSVLDAICADIESVLQESSYAIYLRGSLAYGGFIIGVSDIDLVVLVSEVKSYMYEELSALAYKHSQLNMSWCELVDISVVSLENVMLPENYRLYLNLSLTGIELVNRGLDVRIPRPKLSREMAELIIWKTVRDCAHTLDNIQMRKMVFYMGQKRGASFLCVWFMRDLIRGLVAFVMEEAKAFSLQIEACSVLFQTYNPEYADLVKSLREAEKNPIQDWTELESLAKKGLSLYLLLAHKRGCEFESDVVGLLSKCGVQM